MEESLVPIEKACNHTVLKYIAFLDYAQAHLNEMISANGKTVSEIMEKTNLSRATFYRNIKNKSFTTDELRKIFSALE